MRPSHAVAQTSGAAFAEHALALSELPNRLLRGVSMSLHVVILPFQGYGLPQQTDHYSGLRSGPRRSCMRWVDN